jgi:hypothetical protein
MGSLAKWGAVAGAAKGAEKALDVRVERENAAIDEARAARLLALKQKHETMMQGTKGEQAVEQIETRGDVQKELQGTEIAAEKDMYEIEAEDKQFAREDIQTFTAEQAALDRESAEGIAAQKISASHAARNRVNDRFQAKNLTETEKGDWGIDLETDVPAVFDKLSGITYIQEGRKLVMAGDKSKPRDVEPTDAHIKLLYEKPEQADKFYDMFGYLPVGYLGLIQSVNASAPAAGAQ